MTAVTSTSEIIGSGYALVGLAILIAWRPKNGTNHLSPAQLWFLGSWGIESIGVWLAFKSDPNHLAFLNDSLFSGIVGVLWIVALSALAFPAVVSLGREFAYLRKIPEAERVKAFKNDWAAGFVQQGEAPWWRLLNALLLLFFVPYTLHGWFLGPKDIVWSPGITPNENYAGIGSVVLLGLATTAVLALGKGARDHWCMMLLAIALGVGAAVDYGPASHLPTLALVIVALMELIIIHIETHRTSPTGGSIPTPAGARHRFSIIGSIALVALIAVPLVSGVVLELVPGLSNTIQLGFPSWQSDVLESAMISGILAGMVIGLPMLIREWKKLHP